MKIEYTQPNGGRVTAWTDSLKIDDALVCPAPEPPKPVRQKWECEAVMIAHEATGSWEPYATSAHRGSLTHERARCKLGFDDSGRVWFADQRAKELANY